MLQPQESPTCFRIKGIFDSKETEIEFKQKVGKALAHYGLSSRNFLIKTSLIGKKCPTISAVRSLKDANSAPQSLLFNTDMVTLLCTWATSYESSISFLKRCNELYSKHPEWIGKLRLIGMNVDKVIDEKSLAEEGIEIVSTKMKPVTEEAISVYETISKLENIDSYYIKDWKCCEALKLEKVSRCIVIDKQGIVRLASTLGHSKRGNALQLLEENIGNVMEGKPVTKKKYPKQKATLKNNDYRFEECKIDLDRFFKTNELDIKTIRPAIWCAYDIRMEKGEEKMVTAKVEVEMEWLKKWETPIERVKLALHEVFDPHVFVNILDKSKNVYTLTYGDTCCACKKPLGIVSQYRCMDCEDIYFCIDCVEKKANAAKKITDLIHTHALYFIQKDSEHYMDEIAHHHLDQFADVVAYGRLELFGGGSLNKVHKGVKCACCEVTPVGVRWVCANCDAIDICQRCFNIAQDETNPKSKEIIEKARVKLHDMKTHVYIRQEFVNFVRIVRKSQYSEFTFCVNFLF
eukprot:TRINITY_DN72471_c0_g1_i1.p1 TRINITY_DN72471_c0_g1~~TRINITY_DN72471_c0_g1_i1.p1  ORF type:complete len:606 (+),score=53.78 TRINITY_DN72471_c0_g1_i1:264-1820(+)